jgi:toxin YoeB
MASPHAEEQDPQFPLFTVASFLNQVPLEPNPLDEAILTALKMKCVAGLMAKKKKDFSVAKENFYDAALQRDPRGMIELANLWYEEGHLEESMRWATLSYHTYFIPKAKPYAQAITFFEKAREDLQKNNSAFSMASKKIKNNINIFLSSKDFSETLRPSHYIWGKREPFYDPSISKKRLIFLHAGSRNPYKNTINELFLSRHDNCERLIVVSQEVALSKKEPAVLGLEHLADIYIKKEDIKSAIQVLQEIDTPESLFKVGLLLHKNKEYKKAVKFYAQSQTSEAYANAGNIYIHELGHEKDAMKKAFSFFEKSSFPFAIINKAEIIRYGWHGETPDINQALKILRDLDESFEGRESNSTTEIVRNNIGSIYRFLNDNKNAKEFYAKSGSAMALNSLAMILQEEGDINGAMALTQNIKSVSAQINYFRNSLKLDEISRDDYGNNVAALLTTLECRPEDLGNILHELYLIDFHDKKLMGKTEKEYEKVSEMMPSHERNLINAKLCSVKNDFDKARLILSTLILQSNCEAISYLEVMDLLEKEHNAKKEQEAPGDEEYTSGSLSNNADSDDEATSRDEEELAPFATKAPASIESPAIRKGKDSAIDAPEHKRPSKFLPAEKRRLKQKRKIAEEYEKHKLELPRLIIKNATKTAVSTSNDLAVVFLSEETKEDFKNLQKTSPKFRELLNDIQIQPWATTGSGKPEVLKSRHEGFKGCISRRLDHENRLVYKVSAGEILIISLEGHYN